MLHAAFLWGTLVVALGPQSIQASVTVAHGLQRAGSVAVAHGLSCSLACEIFPDQGQNPRPLYWQADSYPLHYQGSPKLTELYITKGES